MSKNKLMLLFPLVIALVIAGTMVYIIFFSSSRLVSLVMIGAVAALFLLFYLRRKI